MIQTEAMREQEHEVSETREGSVRTSEIVQDSAKLATQALCEVRNALIAADENSGPISTDTSGKNGHKLTMFNTLTPRERQVLYLIADGLSTKEVAARLGITYKTAVSHRTHLLEKTECHESVTLVRLAIKAGIVNP